MAKCAFRDAKRNHAVTAEQAAVDDRNNKYYCLNKECNTEMRLCSKKGLKVPYFRALPTKGHIKNCPYKNDTVPFIRSIFDESLFKFENTMDNILAPDRQKKKDKNKDKNKDKDKDKDVNTVDESKVNSKGDLVNHKLTINTILQLYQMCKETDIDKYYGDTKVGSMILDDRTKHMYPKGCFYKKLVEAKACEKFYNDHLKEIYLIAPINSGIPIKATGKTVKYKFILKFKADRLYETYKQYINNNLQNDPIIVIAGYWRSNKVDTCKTTINSKKQIYLKI